jgi:peptide/nickel transport system ATP-binding protein/oligopeptide transport system ATP-binding protein
MEQSVEQSIEQDTTSFSQNGKEDLIIVDNLVKYFPIRGGFLQRVQAWVRAVDGVSFTVRKGETLGLVGESGCGKTTVGRTILGLIPHDGGSVFFEGQDVLAAFASDTEHRKQKRVWLAIFTAFLFLPGPLTGQNIFTDPADGIRATLPFLIIFSVLFVAAGLWSGLVAENRWAALKGYFRENTPVYVAGVVLGLVWFNGSMALLEGLGLSTMMSALISSALLVFGGYLIHRRYGKIVDRRVKALRRDMQIVFQDPYSSLDPRVPVGDSIGEGLLVHGEKNSSKRYQVVLEMLDQVGLQDFHARRYPHEFSGGQRQRIGIARALALGPKFIVCDEPVSALDVSIQAQVLNILKDLQRDLGFSYLFIAHNLSVVEHISDRVAVMYLGKMVELAERQEMFENPLHPYTQALMSAIPVPDPTLKRERVILKGDVPSPVNPPSGCRFHPRCPVVMDHCSQEEPEFKDIGAGHFAACWRVE